MIDVDDLSRMRIMGLLGAFTALLDTGRWDEWAELFTEDGTFEVGERGFVGQEALRAFAAQSTSGVHVTGMPLIERSQRAFVVRSPFLFVAAKDGRTLAGSYTDDITMAGDRALFARRRVEIVHSTTGGGS